MGKRQRILDADGEARFQKALKLVNGDPNKIRDAVRTVLKGNKELPFVPDPARRTFLYDALKRKLARRLLQKQRKIEKHFGKEVAARMRRDGEHIEREQESEAARGTPIT